MKINVFEGARRIALLLSIVATLIVVGLAVVFEPYVTRSYVADSPDAPFVKTESCDLDDVTVYANAVTPDGVEPSIRLCIPTMPYGDYGQRMFAVTKTDKRISVVDRYDDKADAYKLALEQRFRLTAADAAEIDSEASTLKRARWTDSLIGLAVGLAIFWACVWAIGWIVRGFAGIPRGRDNRPE
ncbi:hypothetical protein AB4Y64_01555 [Lysobacter sp. TAF61]|uniref:hypothetical protein n=1 Tax=Lysobacter sp. TAF61 TaxID=3233072 RepID=UPI003F985C23